VEFHVFIPGHGCAVVEFFYIKGTKARIGRGNSAVE
jgi:hypothetical protein